MNHKILTVILIIPLLMSCKSENSNKHIPPKMSGKQKDMYHERLDKSIDIEKSLANLERKTLKQEGPVEKIDLGDVPIDTVNVTLPEEITIPKMVETENYWYVYNARLSPSDSNIAKYDKQGNLKKLFAGKGKGPNEVISISAIAEKDYKTYVANDANIKVFNRNDQMINQLNLFVWPKDISLTTDTYDIRTFANEVFSFPLYIYDINTDTLAATIKDRREDIYNFQSSDNTTYFSNDSTIIYAKTPSAQLHFFSKEKMEFSAHYQINADFIRKNDVKPLADRPSKSRFYSFFNELFLLDRIHLYENRLFVTFVDNKKDTHYLIVADLSDAKGQDEILFKAYELTDVFKIVHFYNDHMYKNDPEPGEREMPVYTLPLSYFL